MHVTAQELCTYLNGKLEGNPNAIVYRPAKIEEGETGTVSFIAHPKYEGYAYTTQASVLLVSNDFKPEKPVTATLIRVENVYQCVRTLLERFQGDNPKRQGIASQAFVHSNTKIAEDVSVGAFSYISNNVTVGQGSIILPQVFLGEDVEIGQNVTLHPGVKIYRGCRVGNDCVIHANTVIGSDGFGFAPNPDGSYAKVPQIGNVVIGNNVDIGSGCVIDRATMGSTLIQDGVKLDNLIQIAHNVEIGKNTVIAAQTGVAGSTKIGKNCMIGGQVGFVGHITIADGSKIQAQSGVARTIKQPHQAWHGSPAFPYNDFLRSQVVFQQLPDLAKQVRDLQTKLDRLENGF